MAFGDRQWHHTKPKHFRLECSGWLATQPISKSLGQTVYQGVQNMSFCIVCVQFCATIKIVAMGKGFFTSDQLW